MPGSAESKGSEGSDDGYFMDGYGEHQKVIREMSKGSANSAQGMPGSAKSDSSQVEDGYGGWQEVTGGHKQTAVNDSSQETTPPKYPSSPSKNPYRYVILRF